MPGLLVLDLVKLTLWVKNFQIIFQGVQQVLVYGLIKFKRCFQGLLHWDSTIKRQKSVASSFTCFNPEKCSAWTLVSTTIWNFGIEWKGHTSGPQNVKKKNTWVIFTQHCSNVAWRLIIEYLETILWTFVGNGFHSDVFWI